MWPIWEWFVDADSYAVWVDRPVASSETSSFGPEQSTLDRDGVVTAQSEHLSLARETATGVTV